MTRQHFADVEAKIAEGETPSDTDLLVMMQEIRDLQRSVRWLRRVRVDSSNIEGRYINHLQEQLSIAEKQRDRFESAMFAAGMECTELRDQLRSDAFWRDWVWEGKKPDEEQVRVELFGYHVLIEQVTRAYMEITDGRFSKPTTDALYIIGEVERRVNNAWQEAYLQGRKEGSDMQKELAAFAAAASSDADRDDLLIEGRGLVDQWRHSIEDSCGPYGDGSLFDSLVAFVEKVDNLGIISPVSNPVECHKTE